MAGPTLLLSSPHDDPSFSVTWVSALQAELEKRGRQGLIVRKEEEQLGARGWLISFPGIWGE